MLCAQLKIIHLQCTNTSNCLIARHNLRWHLLKQHAISRSFACQTIATNKLTITQLQAASIQSAFNFVFPQYMQIHARIPAHISMQCAYVLIMRFDLKIIIAMILKLASFLAETVWIGNDCGRRIIRSFCGFRILFNYLQ